MSSVPKPHNPLALVYQDDDLLAVHKPAGLLVHRSPIDRHETEFALQYARALNGGRHVYPVHRLDRPTSGLLLFARKPEVAKVLGEQMMAHRVRKTYLAIVRGWPQEQGRIDHALREEPDDRRLKGQTMIAREAVTEYVRLGTTEIPYAVEGYPTSRYALMELAPVTGRRHQLRRHMKHISHPIIGDANHGRGRHNRFFAEHFGEARLFLASVGMRFSHPVTDEPLNLTAKPEAGFGIVAEQLGWGELLRCRFGP
ncbi:tRNA pseudouridine(65) synthase TruC [Marinobacter nanhaiticus D15-8W]|uniref:tRNA pseudouridine synthase C n=1 Tax=Marinobacter nanhaiticus D15-8W TaxID=626887 RepID=N6WZJ6_9GAMM|nr:pseudouridine synthase [Marinobacter nanhaiticus]ENO16597.1 pseudouridylate synthase [Marinobacter nanhaiticus D15-8W]BES72394.1 tRNA pseudouridine(65) synthase TruC [Marinobacter nanhaiticus D15-8W]